jgi:hypothetical protein
MVGYITRSLTLEKAFERLLIYIAIVSTAMIALQRTPYGKIALVVGFAAITFFISLYIASLKISKLYMK